MAPHHNFVVIEEIHQILQWNEFGTSLKQIFPLC